MKKIIELCNINAVSANEKKLAEFICDELREYADEVIIDSVGNVIVHKCGNAPKLMLCTGMDETGGVVTYVSDDNKAYFNFVGEVKCDSVVNMTAEFLNGKKGVVCVENQKSVDDLKSSDLYIDMCGETTGIAEVFSIVSEPVVGNSSIIAKACGIRAGVYTLIETVKSFKNTQNDIYAVFASRSQIGFKGVKVAGKRIAPQYCVCIGVCGEENNIKCGNGFVINLKSGYSISDTDLVQIVKNVSEENDISYTEKVSKDGIFAGGFVKCCGEGVKVLDVLIPTKYKDSPRQYIDLNDVKALTDMLIKLCESDFNF